MANFFASAVSSHAPKEEIRVGGHSVVVKQRIAEGGFGFVDLVSDSQNRDMVVSLCANSSFITNSMIVNQNLRLEYDEHLSCS